MQKKLQTVNDIIASLPNGEVLLKNTVELSDSVLQTTGIEGKDNINQEIKQLKLEWENLQQICKDTKKILEKCLLAWSDFLSTMDKLTKWVKEFDNKLSKLQKVDKITPEYLEKCRVSKHNRYQLRNFNYSSSLDFLIINVSFFAGTFS